MRVSFSGFVGFLLLLSTVAAGAADLPADRFGPADLARLADVDEPAFAPDGESVVYTVTVTNVARDETQSDLWRIGYDGRDRTQLTNTPRFDEWAPAWSPDGRWLAFLSDRGNDDAQSQVWALPVGGGEARVLTNLPGGVDDFEWSPDSRQLALVAMDPERPAGAPQPRNPPPIVTDRFHFKQDIDGYIGARRSHLYLHDVARGQTTQLTSGAHDETYPSWSPDGRRIVYVTHRGEDADRHSQVSLHLIEPLAGATEQPLAQLDGADSDSTTDTFRHARRR